jgi:hypothetical protein
MNDFISFLEGNFPSAGTPAQKEEDIILDSLLRDGSKVEVKEEFDDAKLLVKQLEKKEFDLEVEFRAVIIETESTGSVGGTGTGKSKTYMEDMRLEEKKRELEARKEVVADYLDRARMRQLKLRKRLEEIRGSADDGYGSRRSSSSSASGSGSSSGSSNSSAGSTSGTRTNTSSSSSSSNAGNSEDKKKDEDAWKKESFGSSRRRGGSGRSRSQRDSSSGTDSGTSGSASQPSSGSSYSSGTQGSNSNSNRERSNTYASASSPSPSPPPSSAGSYGQRSNDQANVPPHRRLTSRNAQVRDDKRRLREIKVDEEIDKMKKELGL